MKGMNSMKDKRQKNKQNKKMTAEVIAWVGAFATLGMLYLGTELIEKYDGRIFIVILPMIAALCMSIITEDKEDE